MDASTDSRARSAGPPGGLKPSTLHDALALLVVLFPPLRGAFRGRTMKGMLIQREAITTLNDAEAGQVQGGTTHLCLTARITTGPTKCTPSRNTCATPHTCRWSGITAQKCG